MTTANRPVRQRKTVTQYSDAAPGTFTVKKRKGHDNYPPPPTADDDNDGQQQQPKKPPPPAAAAPVVKRRKPGRPPGPATAARRLAAATAAAAAAAAAAASTTESSAAAPSPRASSSQRGSSASTASTASYHSSTKASSNNKSKHRNNNALPIKNNLKNKRNKKTAVAEQQQQQQQAPSSLTSPSAVGDSFTRAASSSSYHQHQQRKKQSGFAGAHNYKNKKNKNVKSRRTAAAAATKTRKRKLRVVSDGMESARVHPVIIPHRVSIQPVLPISSRSWTNTSTNLAPWRSATKPPPQPKATPLPWPTARIAGGSTVGGAATTTAAAAAATTTAGAGATGGGGGGGGGPRRIPPPPTVTCWSYNAQDPTLGCGGDADGGVVLARWHPLWQPLLRWQHRCNDDDHDNDRILACHWSGPYLIVMTERGIECRNVVFDAAAATAATVAASDDNNRNKKADKKKLDSGASSSSSSSSRGIIPKVEWALSLESVPIVKKATLRIQLQILGPTTTKRRNNNNDDEKEKEDRYRLLWTRGKGPWPMNDLINTAEDENDDTGLYCLEWKSSSVVEGESESAEKGMTKPSLSVINPYPARKDHQKKTTTCLTALWDRTTTAAGDDGDEDVIVMVALRLSASNESSGDAGAATTSSTTSTATSNVPALEILRFHRDQRKILACSDLPVALGRGGSTAHLECHLQQQSSYTFLSTFRGIHMYETETLTLLQTFGESVALHGKIVHWQSCCWLPAPTISSEEVVATKRRTWIEHADELQVRYPSSDEIKAEANKDRDWLLVGIPHPWKEPEELKSTLYVWRPGQSAPLRTLQAPEGGLLACQVLSTHNSLWQFMGATVKPSSSLPLAVDADSNLTMMQQLWSWRPTFQSDCPGVQYPVGYQVIEDNIEFIEDEDELDKVVVLEEDVGVKGNQVVDDMKDAVVDVDGTINHDPDLAEALRRSVLEQSMSPQSQTADGDTKDEDADPEDEPVSVLDDGDDDDDSHTTSPCRSSSWQIPCRPEMPDIEDDIPGSPRPSFTPLSPTTRYFQDLECFTCLPQYRHAREESKELQQRVSSLLQEQQQAMAAFETASSTSSQAALTMKTRGKRTRTANVEALLRASINPALRDRMNQQMRVWTLDGKTGSVASCINDSVCNSSTNINNKSCRKLPLLSEEGEDDNVKNDNNAKVSAVAAKAKELLEAGTANSLSVRLTGETILKLNTCGEALKTTATTETNKGNEGGVQRSAADVVTAVRSEESKQVQSNGTSEGIKDSKSVGMSTGGEVEKSLIAGNNRTKEGAKCLSVAIDGSASTPSKYLERERRSPSISSRVSAEEKELAMELLLLSPRPSSVDGSNEKSTKSENDSGEPAVEKATNREEPDDAIVTPSEQSPDHLPINAARTVAKESSSSRAPTVSCAACQGRMVLHRCGKREKPIDYEAIERAERERKEREEAEKQQRRVEKRRAAEARRREARRKKKEEEERKRAEEEQMRQLEAEKFEQAKIREREEEPGPEDRRRSNAEDWNGGFQPSFSPLKSHSEAEAAQGPNYAASHTRDSHSSYTREISEPQTYSNSEAANSYSTQPQSYSSGHPESMSDGYNARGSPHAYNTEEAHRRNSYSENPQSYSSGYPESRNNSYGAHESSQAYNSAEESHRRNSYSANSQSYSSAHPESRNNTYGAQSQSYTTSGRSSETILNDGTELNRSAALSTSDALEALAGLANSMPAAVPSRQTHNFTSKPDHSGNYYGVSSSGYQRDEQTRQEAGGNHQQSQGSYSARIPSYDQIRRQNDAQYYQPSGHHEAANTQEHSQYEQKSNDAQS